MGRHALMLRTYHGPPGSATINDTWEEVMEDKINHPSHYTKGIECIDYIESQELGYHAGNAIKYITRYRHKNGVEDLKKAAWYIQRLIKIMEVNGPKAADDNGWDVDCSIPLLAGYIPNWDIADYEKEQHIEVVRETQEAMREQWNDPGDWRDAPLTKPCFTGDDEPLKKQEHVFWEGGTGQLG